MRQGFRIVLSFGVALLACSADRNGNEASAGAGGVNDTSGRKLLGERVPMRDGKHLMANVLLPDPKGRYPAIFIHTPYNREYGNSPVPDKLFSKDLLDRENYAFVLVDQRGFHGSKAAARGSGQIDHGLDGYDVVEWIAKQPWSNGKIGTWGTSAVGAVQYQTASRRPPHLGCAVPASANFGFPYEQFYYGGVLQLYYFKVFEAAGHSAGKIVRKNSTPNKVWAGIERKFDSASIDLPMLLITGWYDTHPALKIDTFLRIRKKHKAHAGDMRLIIGPWRHTALGGAAQGVLHHPNAEGHADQQALRFFDRCLRGKSNGWDREPPIRYFLMGREEWHSARTWPPPTREARYFLEAGGRLSSKPPAATGSDVYRYDPAHPTPTVGGNLIELRGAKLQVLVGPQDLRKVESRSDVMTYTTPVLKREVSIVGEPRVRLFVSSDRVDTDFAVRLSDVHPDGRSILVTDGIQRARFRRSLERPELLKPGRVAELVVVLPPTAITFLPGHRIRISVSSSNWPRFEANPNLGRKRLLGPRRVIALNHIHRGQPTPSALLLPVLPEM